MDLKIASEKINELKSEKIKLIDELVKSWSGKIFREFSQNGSVLKDVTVMNQESEARIDFTGTNKDGNIQTISLYSVAMDTIANHINGGILISSLRLVREGINEPYWDSARLVE